MKKAYSFLAVILFSVVFLSNCSKAQNKGLKLVFIRHAERPDDGDNLTCQGFNRSMLLPSLLLKKFGRPDNIYIPALALGNKTKRARMLQTVSPLLIKYNLSVNSAYEEEDYKSVGDALLRESGTVFIVWEHKNIAPIVKYLGVDAGKLNWKNDDYDSIWIITFHKGRAILTRDTEGLNPSSGCPF